MSKLRVGINGFGRIGRALFRINSKKELFDIVAINDVNPDINNMAYLLQYDTTYGRLKRKVSHTADELLLEESRIKVFHFSTITEVPWHECDVDLVIDSSGITANLDLMLSKNHRVKNFIITHAPSGYETIKTIIFGVNEHECDPAKSLVFSSSICDTIALTPIINLITATHDIECGFLTTLHPWLSYQNLLDGPSISWSQPGDVFSHYALGRASPQNIIPKSTSAIKAAEKVFPRLSEKISSFSYRVPTEIVSSGMLTLTLNHTIDIDEIKERFTAFEESQKESILLNSEEPLTSTDYKKLEYSLTVDHRWTEVKKGKHVRLVYWYDNEWGYSSRVVDLADKIGKFAH